MPASFDILRSPFVLLGVDLSASAEDVTEAFEDALADGLYAEQELVQARQSLITPLRRLDAELQFLPDTPANDRRAVLTALKSSQDATRLRNAFQKLPVISKANLCAHIASHSAADADTLNLWVTSQAEIDPEKVYAALLRSREAAGVVRPHLDAVSNSLRALRAEQARAIFDGFAVPADSIQPVKTCTERVIDQQDEKAIDVLGILLSQFERLVDQELSLRRERVEATFQALKEKPDEAGNFAVAEQALRTWNEAAEPLQLFESHKGRNEPKSQSLYQWVRGIAIDLANEQSRFDVALSITRSCKQTFSKLARALDQLAEDETSLNERILYSGIEPLAKAIDQLGADLTKFAGELRKGAFGSSAIGNAKEIRAKFIDAVKATSGKESAEAPWLILRSLAIKLNNELEDTDAALALTSGVLDLTNELKPPEEVISRARDDKRALRRNQLEKELLQCLEQSRLQRAIEIIGNLLQDFKSPEERDTLTNLQGKVQRKIWGRYLRWGFWPAVALCGLVISNLNDKSYSTRSYPSPSSSTYSSRSQPGSYQPPPSRPALPPYQPPRIPSAPERTTPSEPARAVELIPPIGRGLQFTVSNVRYCMYQKVRLENIKPELRTAIESDSFNELVRDYNSRCSDYMYFERDRGTVEGELLLKGAELRLQAQRTLQEWRQKYAARQPVELPVPETPSYVPPSASRPAPTESSSQPLPLPVENSGNAAPENSVQDSYSSDRIDLLRLNDATRVQSRLIELGFLKGVADGTWGPQSRAALRSFRAAVNLPASDAWTSDVAERLFSTFAPKAPNVSTPLALLPDAAFPAPSGASLNPLNKEHAAQIHMRLRALGFYAGRSNELWSPMSRNALRDFKASQGLPANDDWDALTEQRLLGGATQASGDDSDQVRFARLFAGTWATAPSACPNSGVGSDALPLTITRSQAKSLSGEIMRDCIVFSA
jgi:peptidoglycan hydrolase-like protein with peptidoglycan-binding domain